MYPEQAQRWQPSQSGKSINERNLARDVLTAKSRWVSAFGEMKEAFTSAGGEVYVAEDGHLRATIAISKLSASE